MISNSTLERISELSKAINDQGKVATPGADTALALLCNNTTITGFDAGDNIVEKIALESDNIVHNSMMDELVGTVSRAVCGHIDFAKNVVNPAIKEVVKYLGTHLDNYTSESVIDTRIERVTLPDFLLNKDIRGEIEGYSMGGVRKYIEPEGVLNLPNIDMDKLPEAVSTGSGNLDVSIGTWLAGQEAGFLNEVYENFFADPKKHRRESVSMISYLNDYTHGYDRAIAIFLLARRIMNSGQRQRNIHFGSRLKQFLEVSSYKVADFIKVMEDAEKNDQIILSHDKTNKVIKVCSATYLPWLEKGNTPEVLYGASLVGGNIFTASKLAERKDELLKAWGVHRSALNSSYRNSYHNGYITALRDGFYKDMANMTEPEIEYHAQNPNAKDEIAKLLEIELREVSLDDRNDHYRTVTRLVARARFFYTDVYKFLSTVDQLTKDGNTSLEEALHVATIEYVADYVSAQILIR